MDRALPGWVVDLIRDGVRPADLRKDGGRAVWSALVRTAASAKQRGWDQWEWAELIEQRQSRLGTQAMLERGKAINRARLHKRLSAAWATAEKWLDERPAAWTHAEVVAELTEIRTWMSSVTTMTDDEMAVMKAAIDIAQEKGTTRPALPWRQVAAVTGLNPRRTRDTIAALGEAGVLVLDQRGYGGRTRRKANLYRLPGADARNTYLYRGSRSMDPSARSMDQPETGRLDQSTDLWTNSGHVTISGSPQALAELLELARTHGVSVIENDVESDNVIPLRRTP